MKNYRTNLFTVLLLLLIAVAAHADVVTGNVLDAQNKPIASAEILMRFKADDSNKWQYLQAICDNHGAFSADFSGKIDFASEAYQSIIYAVAPGKAYSVARLQPKNNILHLDDAEEVRGQVLDQNGKPVAGAKINLHSASGKSRQLSVILKYEKPWATRFQTFTDKNGDWKLKVVPEGETAYLEVNDPRFVSADLSAQQGAKPISVRLRPGAVISGRLVDDKGKPLANVKILAKEGWQSATTNEHGIFRLTGLTPRSYHISLDAGDRPVVIADIETRIAAEGEIKNLSDIVMTPGGIVTGTVVNLKTGEPISGATVGSSGNPMLRTLIRLLRVDTNEDGKYELRLPPGEHSVFCSNQSKKYFEQTYFKTIDIEEGKTVTQNFEIDPGVTLSGTAVDEHGKPVKDVTVWVDAMAIESDYKLLPRKAITDANGNWSISGIAPRKVQVRVGEPWATDKLVTFTLPHPAKVQLHLIPQNDLPPIGRLMNTNGKPLVGIKATVQYQMPHPTPFDIKTNIVLTSDKNGYLHFRMPLVAGSPTISDIDIDIKGYQWTSGGEWDDKTQHFSDVNLDPLTRKINGHVVDAYAKPVANARVLVVGLGRNETITKDDGSFAFDNLPNRQQLTLLAIGKAGVAKVLSSISQTSATLHLSPLQQNLLSREESLDALETLYDNSVEVAESNSIIGDMVRYDVPRMLKMIQGKQKVFPATEIPQALDSIASINPQMALQWGTAYFAQVVGNDRIAVLCQLVKLAAAQNNPLAQKYFSQAVELAEALPVPKEKKYEEKNSTEVQTLVFLQSRIQLAGAAAKVQPAQTKKWVDEVLQFSKDNSGSSMDWPRSELVSALAISAPQETARVIASDAESKVFNYQYAVQAAAEAGNLKWALYWLAQFRSFASSLEDRSSAYFNLQEATTSTISLVGPNDPKEALQIARSIDSSIAMVAAAQFQSHETALSIFHEAFNSGHILGDARLVGLIYNEDEAEGKVLFDELVKTYWVQLNTDIMTRRSASEIAYSLARYKSPESWLMLQTEWAQSQVDPNSRTSSQARLALAMSGVNFQEAMKWARHIESRDKELSLKTQRQLLEIALATPQQRRDLSVLGFYISDSYKPGDAVSW